ncbi:hypothetical protein [Pararhizobium sp. A13]|uniref:hypothetical protein n=1 Tax=Pararhizobium sp. A13 TaxID=3133975 RepID=UPI003251F120
MSKASPDHPIVKAIQSAIIGILFSKPETGRRLAALELHSDTTLREGVQFSDEGLWFNSERVKALTRDELAELLLTLDVEQ